MDAGICAAKTILMTSERLFEITRYAVVGFLTLLVYLSLGYFLQVMGISIPIISLVAFIVAIVVNYLLQKVWVFSDSQSAYKSLPKYLLMVIVGYFINLVSLVVMTNKFSLILAQIVAVVFVTLSNAVLSFFWIFRKNKR